MASNRTKDWTQAGSANVITKIVALTGTAAEPKTVKTLRWTEYTAAGEQNNATLVVYKDQLQITEFNISHKLQAFDVDSSAIPRKLELNIELDDGEELTVGHLSGSTASDLRYNLEYEITGE